MAVLLPAIVLAAGCGGGSHPRTTTRVARGDNCTLSAKQHHVIRRANSMIVRMHRIDNRLNKVHEHGPMKLELLLNRFQLSIGVLPVLQREDLIRKAKSAVGLCHDCFEALEAMEPAVQTSLGESPCKAGF